MNILLTYSLFMMGLLSYTDWLRLRAEKSDTIQKIEECQGNCSCSGKGKPERIQHHGCRLVISESVHNQADAEIAEQSISESIIGLLYYKRDHDQHAGISADVSDFS